MLHFLIYALGCVYDFLLPVYLVDLIVFFVLKISPNINWVSQSVQCW